MLEFYRALIVTVFEITSPSELPFICRMYSPLSSIDSAVVLHANAVCTTTAVGMILVALIGPTLRRPPDIVTNSPGFKSVDGVTASFAVIAARFDVTNNGAIPGVHVAPVPAAVAIGGAVFTNNTA